MDPYYVNVIVSDVDDEGAPIEFASVCYKFDNWEDATQLIKLSIDNGLSCEVLVPNSVRRK
jgi:hypothetical protein